MVAKIKFCGMMQGQDAAAAVDAGAGYLGVVFASGPRRVSQQQAREVVAAAAEVPVLGVFVDQSPDEILRIAEFCELAGAQLHGPYTAAEAGRLRAGGLKVWRVVRLAGRPDLRGVEGAEEEADAVLIEPRVPNRLGGAGISLDLPLAVEARRRIVGSMVLAGGLRPDTVGAALASVRPDIVDVSSGVEHRPGIKDPQKMKQFTEAVVAHSAHT